VQTRQFIGRSNKNIKGEKRKLDKYHYRELRDRAYVAHDHFYEYVEEHYATQENKELKAAAEKVTEVMYDFYCLCGFYTKNENDNQSLNSDTKNG